MRQLRQLTDLSECVSTYTKVVREAAKTELKHIKVTVKRRRCRNCKKTVSGRTPLALPNSRYGINFMIMMVILRLHGMSDLRICNIVMIMYSARITESAINRMVCRMARELVREDQGGGKKLACDTGTRRPGASTAQTIGCGWL